MGGPSKSLSVHSAPDREDDPLAAIGIVFRAGDQFNSHFLRAVEGIDKLIFCLAESRFQIMPHEKTMHLGSAGDRSRLVGW